jgi:hypothetical protein
MVIRVTTLGKERMIEMIIRVVGVNRVMLGLLELLPWGRRAREGGASIRAPTHI